MRVVSHLATSPDESRRRNPSKLKKTSAKERNTRNYVLFQITYDKIRHSRTCWAWFSTRRRGNSYSSESSDSRPLISVPNMSDRSISERRRTAGGPGSVPLASLHRRSHRAPDRGTRRGEG